MGVSATLKIEAQLAPGVWTDLTPDAVAVSGLRLQYGINGAGPLDRVASTGELSFQLRNDAGNSGGTQGWYSPVHVNRRTGWTFGIPIRISFTHASSTWVKFLGKIGVIEPEPGAYGSQRVSVTAYDAMRDLMDADVRTLALAVDQPESVLINAVLDALPAQAQPATRSIDTGVDVYPYAFDNVGGGVKAGGLLTDVVISSLGMLFATGNGTLTYRNRQNIATAASAFTFANTMRGVRVPSTLDQVYNRVRVTIHPKTIDATATTVLYAATGEPPLVPSGETIVVWGDYRSEENTRTQIGGVGTVTPLVAGTDYAANSLKSGSGSDLTASVSVTATPYASTVKFQITNSALVPAYLVNAAGATTLQIRGKGVYDDGPQTFEASSVQPYGDRPLAVDMPYQDDAYIGQSAAAYLEAQYRGLSQHIEELAILGNESTAFMTQALAREPGDRITISETVTGLALVDAIIQQVELEVRAGTMITCRWGLAPASPFSVWQLGVAGASELDTKTVLGF